MSGHYPPEAFWKLEAVTEDLPPILSAIAQHLSALGHEKAAGTTMRLLRSLRTAVDLSEVFHAVDLLAGSDCGPERVQVAVDAWAKKVHGRSEEPEQPVESSPHRLRERMQRIIADGIASVSTDAKCERFGCDACDGEPRQAVALVDGYCFCAVHLPPDSAPALARLVLRLLETPDSAPAFVRLLLAYLEPPDARLHCIVGGRVRVFIPVRVLAVLDRRSSHQTSCPIGRLGDDDWNDATALNYTHTFGQPPACICTDSEVRVRLPGGEVMVVEVRDLTESDGKPFERRLPREATNG